MLPTPLTGSYIGYYMATGFQKPNSLIDLKHLGVPGTLQVKQVRGADAVQDLALPWVLPIKRAALILMFATFLPYCIRQNKHSLALRWTGWFMTFSMLHMAVNVNWWVTGSITSHTRSRASTASICFCQGGNQGKGRQRWQNELQHMQLGLLLWAMEHRWQEFFMDRCFSFWITIQCAILQ